MRNGPFPNTCCCVAFLLLAALLLFLCPAAAQKSPLVLLLNSKDSEPYNQTVAAFKESLVQSLPDAQFMYHLVDDGQKDVSGLFSKDAETQPALIFSLGTGATQIAQSSFRDTPLLATMVVDETSRGNSANKSALVVQYSPEVQLQWLKKFLPHAKRVGILYDPAENSDWVSKAKDAARKKNLTIVPFEVSSVKKLKAGLKYISRNADVLMAIPDQTVYSGKTAKEVLLFSYRNRIPFVGLSASWVKAGALYALGVDYPDLGRQAAGLASNILSGNSPGKTTFYPDKVTYTINARTKDYLHLEMANGLIAGSAKVFE